MKARTLGILLILVLGLGSYVYFAIQMPAERRALDGGTPPVAPGDLTQIESLNIQIKDLNVRLERDGAQWRMTAPVKDLASDAKVTSLMSALQKMRETKIVATAEKLKDKKLGLVQYGLDQPKAMLTYKAPDQKDLVTLSIGDQNPAQSGNYVLRSTDNAVVLSGLDLDYLATQRSDDFREMKLTTVAPEDFAKVEISVRGKRISLERINNEWQMLAPYQLPLDAEMVRNTLEKISLIRGNTFMTHPPKNLGPPAITAVIGFKEGIKDLRTTENDSRPAGTEIQLYEIKEASKFKGAPGVTTSDKEIYLAKGDKTDFATIAKFHFENLAKSPEDFVRKTFDDFLISDIEKATIKRSGGVSFDLKRVTPDAFDLVQGQKQEKTAAGKADDLFRQLRNMRALKFLDSQKAPPPPGTSSLRVEIDLKDGERRILDLRLKKDSGELFKEIDGRWLRFLVTNDPVKVSDFDPKNLLPSQKAEDNSAKKE